MSRRLNILCDHSILYNNAIRPFICEGGILLAYGKHLHDRIILLGGNVCAHKASLTPPLFVEVPVPSGEIETSCMCVLEVSILPLSMIFLSDFEAVSTAWYFFFFILLHYLEQQSYYVYNITPKKTKCFYNIFTYIK